MRIKDDMIALAKLADDELDVARVMVRQIVCREKF